MPRKAAVHRKTNETEIKLSLNLDGHGKARISTGIRFFDHMLELVARHGGFDLQITARGDLDVDQHHTVEDVGIAIGEAVLKAVGNKRGILRAGYFVMPMDESLAVAAVDWAGVLSAWLTPRLRQRGLAIFRQNWWRIFFRGLHRPRAPTFICAFCMGVLRITRWRRCSRRSRGPCVLRWRATSDFEGCCPAPRVCYENIAHRLRRGESSFRGTRLASACVPTERVDSPEGVTNASALILPGVGHYAALIRALDKNGLREALLDAISRGIPFLGICLGLQALYQMSEEAPDLKGLNIFPGCVRGLTGNVKLPHMGWNQVRARSGSRLLEGIDRGAYFYFAHSFAAQAQAPTNAQPEVQATCAYGSEFVAVAERENIFGVQFHPEKSGGLGQRVLQNFLRIAA